MSTDGEVVLPTLEATSSLAGLLFTWGGGWEWGDCSDLASWGPSLQMLRIFPSSPPEPCFALYQRKQFLVTFGLEAVRAETQNLKANPENTACLRKSPEVHIAFPGTVRAQENSAHED